jgi:hypothetical protein
MSEPLWNGPHGRGAMRRHREDLRTEAAARQKAYDAAHPKPEVKLLEAIFTVPKDTGQDTDGTPMVEMLSPGEPKPRRKRTITRKHTAHTDK